MSDWQLKSLGWLAAFELDCDRFTPNFEEEWMNKDYWFDVDKALNERRDQITLPAGVYLNGIVRGTGLFVEIESDRKPTQKHLDSIQRQVLSVLDEAFREDCKACIESWNED